MSPLWLGYKRLLLPFYDNLYCLLWLYIFQKVYWYNVRPTRQGIEGSLRAMVSEELTLSVQQQEGDWILPTSHEWSWKLILDHISLEMTAYLANTMTTREELPKIHAHFYFPELWDTKIVSSHWVLPLICFFRAID